jgi:hypothetical protein
MSSLKFSGNMRRNGAGKGDRRKANGKGSDHTGVGPCKKLVDICKDSKDV